MFSRWTNSHHDQENDPHQAELKVMINWKLQRL